jgi:hypothetical protein
MGNRILPALSLDGAEQAIEPQRGGGTVHPVRMLIALFNCCL